MRVTSSRIAGLVLAAAFALMLGLPARADESTATWEQIRPDLFGTKPIADGAALVSIAAPKRAEDAALVPIDVHIHVPDGDARRITALTLLVDENPSPVVATFRFGDGKQAFDLSTRVRVNSYSFVRAVAETSDGRLYMVDSYVKAAGGCSAPAVKDPQEAKAHLGEMRFRVFADTGRPEAQVQLRHPNYSGMQMDQVTRLYRPAWFVETLSVRQGEHPLFSLEGGISLSEDPTFRFTYSPDGTPVTVEAKDSEGNVFKKTFPGGQAS